MKKSSFVDLLYVFILFFCFKVIADDNQEFTFLVEPAYTQEQDEWQFNLQLNGPDYKHDISSDLEVMLSIEYGFTNNLQLEFSANKTNELEDDFETETETETEYELGLSYRLFEQHQLLPQITLGSGVVYEDSEYGFEMAVLCSYQVSDSHFIHGNLVFEEVDSDKNTSAKFAYAFVFSDSWTVLAEFERNRASDEVTNSFKNTFSTGLVFETESEIEVGLAYLNYSQDTEVDNSLQFKIAYEF